MQKITIFACLGFALVFALSSFAGDPPPIRTMGNSTIHGGNANLNKAGLDTINLMAASNDPTNNNDPRDGGLEPYYDGDFEDDLGNPAWNGWTHYDVTRPTGTHWNVSTYNQPVVTNYAAWCGDINFPSCGGTDPVGGYGAAWHDLIEFRRTVPNLGSSSTVTITATLIHDSEPGYDYTYLSYRYEGEPLGDIQSWDGTGSVAVNGSASYLPQELVGGTDIAVYFRFNSDAGWDDGDCSFPSAGGCQVDDINVHIVNGAFDANYFEDFEHGGVADDFGLWNIAFPDGVGDFAHLWSGLEDNDPCYTNYTPQVAFIDDGIVVPGTGGSDCVNWCYGPGGYIVTTTGGLAGETAHIHNAIESPVMAWPSPKNSGDPEYDGIIFGNSVYIHEDLSADAPGIFTTWGIRSADTDGSAGNGIQVITNQPWRDRNFVSYGGPYYANLGRWVTDLMNAGRDEVQVQLAVLEYGWVWGWNGNDGYPAPYFDNVIIKIFPYYGPGMSGRSIDLAQDNFPDRGSIDMGDPGSHSVRFDSAMDISGADHLRNDPGDSIVVDIVPVRAGAELDGNPEMYYIMNRNPVFDPYRTAGLPDMGFVVGDSAVGISGSPTPGKWAFDLPDTGFLFPGDVLHYYFSATDAIGGVGGSNPQTTTMPWDTTGFSTGFGDPMGYYSALSVRALPSIRDDGFGGYEQPEILFINDGSSNLRWSTALNNIGLLVEDDYDVYYVNGYSSGIGNGIGGRASSIMLTDYSDILYTSGSIYVHTISNGDFNNDPGDDIGTLTNWLDQGGKDIFLTGDGLAGDLSRSGTETLTFLENYMGLTMVTNDVRPFIGNQTTPLVEVIPGNPVFGGILQSWIAYGGCFSINTFDGVNVFGTGQRIAEFVDPDGGDFGFAAATLNIVNPGLTQSRVISMPVDLRYVYTNPAVAGNDLSAKSQLLKDVLMYFGIAGDPQNVSPVLPGITFQTSNYPNPFNPSTTIKYSIPAAGHLKLSIYNVRGQLVKTMIDGNRPAGADQTIVWDGTNNQGGDVSSGIYFYEARTGGEVKVRKMALVK